MKTISTKKKKKTQKERKIISFPLTIEFGVWLGTFKAIRKKWESGGMKAALPNIYNYCPTYKFNWIT